MSESQRQKVKEYDWKKAAARRLQLKCDKIAKKESDKSRKRKSRAKLKVSTSQKYAKHVEKVVKLAVWSCQVSNTCKMSWWDKYLEKCHKTPVSFRVAVT